MPTLGTFTEFYERVNGLSTAEYFPQYEVRLNVANEEIEVKERGSNWFDRVVCWLEDKSPIFIGKGRKQRNLETLSRLIESIEKELIDVKQKESMVGACREKQRKNKVLRYRDMVSLNEKMETARRKLRVDFNDIRPNIVYCEADLCRQNLLAGVDVRKSFFSPVVKRLYEIADGDQSPGGNELEATELDTETKAQNFLLLHPGLSADNFDSRCLEKLMSSIASETLPAAGLPDELVGHRKQLQIEAVTMVLEQMDPGLVEKIKRNLPGTVSPSQGGLEELAKRLRDDCFGGNNSLSGVLTRKREASFKTDPGMRYLTQLTAIGQESEDRFVSEIVIPALYGLKQVLREKGRKDIAEVLEVSGLDMEATRNHVARVGLLHFSGYGDGKVETPSEREVQSFLSDSVVALLWLQAEKMASIHNADFPAACPDTPSILSALARFEKNICIRNGLPSDTLQGESFVVNLLLNLEETKGEDDDLLNFYTLKPEVDAFTAIKTLAGEQGIEDGPVEACCRALEDVLLDKREAMRGLILREVSRSYEQVRENRGGLTTEAFVTCGAAAISEYVARWASAAVAKHFGIEKPVEYFIGP